MKKRPIGVFDSGLGGLTAVKELIKALPGEDIIYLGDTARVPYGTKSHDTIVRYAKEDIAFLNSMNVKLIIIACGTVSSALSLIDGVESAAPIISVVLPAATAAVNTSKALKIGVIGTPATVKNGCYERTIKSLNSKCEVFSKACTLFVPLVEAGHFGKDDPLATLAAEEYLPEFNSLGIDTLILGCTHYPLLTDVISKILPNVALINSGAQTALKAKELLLEKGLLNPRSEGGEVSYYVTDNIEGFKENAGRFLNVGFGITPKLITL